MNQSVFRRLTLVALAVVALTALVLWQRAPQQNLADGAEKLLPEMERHIDDLTEVRFLQSGKKALFTLKKGDKGWVVPEQNGFPADVIKVREYLQKLADANVLEAKTSKPEKYAALGLVDIDKAEAEGVEIELLGLKKPSKVLIGRYHGQGTGTFVRRNGEAQSYLVSGSLVVDKNPVSWLATQLFDLDSSKVRAVKIVKQGKLLSILKESPAAASFAVENLPAGATLSSDYVANPIATALTAFRAEAVQPVATITPPEANGSIQATYFLFDGTMIDLVGWQSEGQRWVTVNASIDSARARIHALADIALEKLDAKAAADEAKAAKADVDKVDANKDVLDKAIEGAAKEGADQEKRIAEAIAKSQKLVDEINRVAHGWTFQIPEYKYTLFDKTLADLTAKP